MNVELQFSLLTVFTVVVLHKVILCLLCSSTEFLCNEVILCTDEPYLMLIKVYDSILFYSIISF